MTLIALIAVVLGVFLVKHAVKAGLPLALGGVTMVSLNVSGSSPFVFWPALVLTVLLFAVSWFYERKVPKNSGTRTKEVKHAEAMADGFAWAAFIGGAIYTVVAYIPEIVTWLHQHKTPSVSWLWVCIGAIVLLGLAGLTAWLVRRPRRTSSATRPSGRVHAVNNN